MTGAGGSGTSDGPPSAVLPDLDRAPSRFTWAREGGPRYAWWWARVVAYLLDGAVLGAVTFLAFAVHPVPAPSAAPMFGSGVPAGTVAAASWTSSPVVVATVLVLALMQAYLGSTPGKLVVGIAVVRDVDGRPAGFARTVGRWFAHLLDAILCIGYLRAAWNPERRTFADSLLGTVVVVRADARTPSWWTPATARAVVAGAWVVCSLAAVFQLGGSSGWSAGSSTTCAVGVATDARAAVRSGLLTVEPGTATTSRWGIERQQLQPGAGVEVRWEGAGLPQDGTYRLAVARPDGSGARTVALDVRDATGSTVTVVGPGGDADVAVEDGALVARFTPAQLDVEELAAEGGSWRWTLTAEIAGQVSAPCSGDLELGRP